MKQKILNQVGVLLTCSILITFLAVSLVMYNRFNGYMMQGVRNEAEYIRIALENTSQDYLTEGVGQLASSRITLVDTDGTVIFDSVEDAADMENHANRPEIVEALKTGHGEAIRYSETLAEQTFYYAERLSDGTVLRVARITDSVFMTLQSSITLLGILVIGIVVVAFFVIQRQTTKLIEPINQMDLAHPLRHVEYEELRPLLVRVHEQNRQIDNQLQELKANHEEYLAITENMKDGLVITNQTEVLSINKAAQQFFHVRAEDCVNKSISRVSRDREVKRVMEQALQGEHSETVIEMGNRSYQVLANPVKIYGKTQGAVILIWDVTEKTEAEQMRREFSANVSHELKTPLMSISGYAELIQNGMVQPKDIPEFASRIHQEASRLTNLVEDIIQLSKLDEKSSEMPYEWVDLRDLTRDIMQTLENVAKKRGVSIEVEGTCGEVYGVRHILYEMLYNLTDNAIKYNVEGGWIHIQMSRKNGRKLWQVSDGGIGIAKEDQERIFERFYRVDKSHSRETGGTGLGLSIVKHGAMMHQAEIRLDSQPGEGTSITLDFPEQTETDAGR